MQSAQVSRELHLLPGRFGPRPRTTMGLPFRQIDQLPSVDMTRLVADFCVKLPGVRVRQSRMGAPGTLALFISGRAAAGPPHAFIDSREFCHVHPAPHGSLQLMLPPAEIEGIVALGWAERHPICHLGVMKLLVLVYAPRTREETEAVFSLVEHSCRFAMGGAGANGGVAALSPL